MSALSPEAGLPFPSLYLYPKNASQILKHPTQLITYRVHRLEALKKSSVSKLQVRGKSGDYMGLLRTEGH